MTTDTNGTFILSSLLFVASAHAEDIGSVDTAFKLFGPDHKILVEVFDDR